ncbi:MAG TPA: DUF167 domain-containing protein [Verrucomicrobiota bacterium]|nr:DUF167 domain-containing protein [Verrucomicrobiota bacterium]
MSTLPSYLKETASGCSLSIRLQPRSSRNEICGQMGDTLKIKVTAPPVDSAANELLVEFLADLLDISKSSVQILKGQTSRSKVVQIAGLKTDQILKKLTNKP